MSIGSIIWNVKQRKGRILNVNDRLGRVNATLPGMLASVTFYSKSNTWKIELGPSRKGKPSIHHFFKQYDEY